MIEISSIAKRKTQNTPKFCDGLHKALSIVLNLIDYISRHEPNKRIFSALKRSAIDLMYSMFCDFSIVSVLFS